MNDLKIVYVTCAENGLYGLKYLLSKGFNIIQVITISPTVAQKNLVSGFVDIRETCNFFNVKVTVLEDYNLCPHHINDNDLDLIIVNGWNRIIKDEVIQKFKYGGIGIHAGHPPIGLGRAPLPWNIIKGFRDIEVYIFRLTKDPDSGDIIVQQTIEITSQDNVRLLYEKVMFTGALLFEKAIEQIPENNIINQSKSYALYYPKRTMEDGLIHFSESVENIYNFIRAQTHPYPGAFAWLEGTKWIIWHAISYDRFAFRNIPRIPGKIIAALPSGIVVQTGSSPLWILEASCNEELVVPSGQIEQCIGKVFNSNRE